MATCSICLDEFKKPVALPCGHIFCTECLVKTVQVVTPARSLHACPNCRMSYSIVPVNPAAIPAHLRPFITPSIRRVYLDTPDSEGSQSSYSGPSSSSPIPISVGNAPTTSPSTSNSELLAKLQAENQALRTHCVMWKRRAELHGAATLGLLDFGRMMRDQAVGLARERDQYKNECRNLKRKLDETTAESSQCTGQTSPIQLPTIPSFTFSYPASLVRDPPNDLSNEEHYSTLLRLQQAAGVNPSPSPASSSTLPPLRNSHTDYSINNWTTRVPVSSASTSSSSPGIPQPESRLEPSAKRLRQDFGGTRFPSVQIPATSAGL